MARAVSESDSEEELKEEEEWTAVRPRNKCHPESLPAFVTDHKSNHHLPHRTSEEVGWSHAGILSISFRNNNTTEQPAT